MPLNMFYSFDVVMFEIIDCVLITGHIARRVDPANACSEDYCKLYLVHT